MGRAKKFMFDENETSLFLALRVSNSVLDKANLSGSDTANSSEQITEVMNQINYAFQSHAETSQVLTDIARKFKV